MSKRKILWIFWPFTALWNLLALLLGITGRVMAGILGIGLMIMGIALIMSPSGAPIGIPFSIFGFLLMLRSLF